MRASSAPCGRGSKNQKFSLPFFFRLSAVGVWGADKKWKRNFWFCFAFWKLHNGKQSIHIEAPCSVIKRRSEALPLRVYLRKNYKTAGVAHLSLKMKRTIKFFLAANFN